MDRRAAREQPVVPALWETEFANVMTVLVRRRLLARHQANAILSRAERLQPSIDKRRRRGRLTVGAGFAGCGPASAALFRA